MSVVRHFTPEFFAFLRDLDQNNNRDWFAANRARFIANVESPMLAFINDFAPMLRSISPAYIVDRRRIGGSMYRIYRDTRFSEDKRPFRTWVAARFEHEARRKVESVPGFYLRLGIDRCIAGGGIYHVERPGLTRIRQRIVDMPGEWRRAKAGLDIQGEQLKRGPAGFPTAHEHLEDLKRKQFYILTQLSEDDVVSVGFIDRFAQICSRAVPLMEFHTKALGLRW
jgi:uncharacterized protein (TIGR02453 family)